MKKLAIALIENTPVLLVYGMLLTVIGLTTLALAALWPLSVPVACASAATVAGSGLAVAASVWARKVRLQDEETP